MLMEVDLNQPESLVYRIFQSESELVALVQVASTTESLSTQELQAITRKAIEAVVALEVGALVLDVSKLPSIDSEQVTAISNDIMLVACYETKDNQIFFPILYVGKPQWVKQMKNEFNDSVLEFFEEQETALKQAEDDAYGWLEKHFPL